MLTNKKLIVNVEIRTDCVLTDTEQISDIVRKSATIVTASYLTERKLFQ